MLVAAIVGEGLLYTPTFIAAAALASGELVELPLGADTLDLGGVYADNSSRPPSKRKDCWMDRLSRCVAGATRILRVPNHELDAL